MHLLLLSLLLAPAAQDPAAPEEPFEEVPWLVDVAPDGSRLGVALRGGRVELWDPVDLRPLARLEPAMRGSRDIAFAPCGRRLAALDEEGKLCVWVLGEAAGGEPRASLRPLLSPREMLRGLRFGAGLSWAPDGERLAVVDSEGRAHLCDASSEPLASWEISRTFGTPAVGWTPDGEHVVTAIGKRAELRALRAGDGEDVARLAGALETPAEIQVLAVHPTRTRIVTGHRRSLAILWDLASGERLRDHHVPDPWLPEEEDEVAGAAFSPDGRWLALSIRQGSHVFVLDVESAELHWTSEYLGAHFSEPLEVAWSPDSSRVWYAFACGHGPVGTHALAPEAREPFTGHGMLPRFGGAVGVTITGSEECCRVVPVHAADAVESRGAQGR